MNHDKKCLLLNCDFSPICIIGWKKAVIWHIKHKYNANYGIQIIENYDDYITCASGKKLHIPAVARTTQFHRSTIYKQSLKMSRKNLFIRDNHTCQYCGKYLLRAQLTYDHVMPKSRFKNHKEATNWTNIVTACIKCNAKKANKTPKEAGMQLLNEPLIPKFSPKYLPWHDQLSTIVMDSRNIWDKYISRYIENGI